MRARCCWMMMIVATLLAAVATDCGQATFSRDLGNTHCPSSTAHVKSAATADACMQACCSQGDRCETFEWCEDGKRCSIGFWAQPGALARGSDLDGWPKNTTIEAAEEACGANSSCAGLTYHSSELYPSSSTI